MKFEPQTPGQAYDRANETGFRDLLKRFLAGVLRTDRDAELQPNARLIMTSPNGTRYAVTIDNAGAFVSTAL
jgi:hypothetical protein